MQNPKSFDFWCVKVLPLVYDDSLSYYEVLCKLTSKVNEMILNDDNLKEILAQFNLEIEQLKQDTLQLQNDIEKVKNGEYVDLYLDSIKNFIDNNLQELVANIVKYIFFGLTNDGYFCASIPSSWEFITFDTIVDPKSPLYGHLILKW